MAFECARLDKWEELIRNDIRDNAESYIMEYYGVEDIDDLTEDQVREISDFIQLPDNEYSLVCEAFTDIINWWEQTG